MVEEGLKCILYDFKAWVISRISCCPLPLWEGCLITVSIYSLRSSTIGPGPLGPRVPCLCTGVQIQATGHRDYRDRAQDKQTFSGSSWPIIIKRGDLKRRLTWERVTEGGKQLYLHLFMFVYVFVSSLDFKGLYSRIKLSLTWGSKFLMSLLEVSPQWLFQLSFIIFQNNIKPWQTAYFFLQHPIPPAFYRKP